MRIQLSILVIKKLVRSGRGQYALKNHRFILQKLIVLCQRIEKIPGDSSAVSLCLKHVLLRNEHQCHGIRLKGEVARNITNPETLLITIYLFIFIFLKVHVLTFWLNV